MNINQFFREFEKQMFADKIDTVPVRTKLPARWLALYLAILFVVTMLLYFLLPIQATPWLLTLLSYPASFILFIPLVKLLKRL